MSTTASNNLLKLAKNTFIVASATFLSRILGFVRDLTLAITLGAGPQADAFFVAFRLPNLLRRLFAEGSLSMAFIPVFAKTKEESLQKAFVVARSLQIWIIFLLSLIVFLGIIEANSLISLIAPGFKDKPQLFELTVTLTQICLPYIIFISSVALYMGILNSLDHFLFPALAPCILNLTLISFALFGHYFKLNISKTLAIGVLAAGILQALSQFPALKKTGFSFKGKIKLFSQELKKIFLLTLPTILGSAVYQINILLITLLASFLPVGSISYLYYADRLVQFPLGVFGIAIGTVALPTFSSLLAQKKIKELEHNLSTAINLNLFISLPAAAGLMALSTPIIQTLFGHGSFTQADVELTAHALIAYSLGLPAFSLTKTLVSNFYAFEDTKRPVFISILSLFTNLTLGFLLMKPLKHAGLALAVSFSSWLNIILLIYFLKKKIKINWDKKEITICLSLSAIIYLIAFKLKLNILGLLLTIIILTLFYILSSYFLQSKSSILIIKGIMKKIKKE